MVLKVDPVYFLSANMLIGADEHEHSDMVLKVDLVHHFLAKLFTGTDELKFALSCKLQIRVPAAGAGN